MPYPFPETLRGDHGDMFDALTIVDANEDNVIISIDEGSNSDRYQEKQVAFVNQDYFEIFPRQWISGNPKTALTEQKSVDDIRKFGSKIFW